MTKSNRVTLLAISIFAFTACQSTDNPSAKQATENKFKDVNFSQGNSFLDAMNSMVADFGVAPQEIESSLGKALWFEYDSNIVDYRFRQQIYNLSGDREKSFYRKLKSTCNGQFGNYGPLSAAMKEKAFNPNLYQISEENVNLLVETYTSTTTLYFAHDNFDNNRRSVYMDFTTSKSHVNEGIDGYGKDLLKTAGIEKVSLSEQFICSQGGVIKEAIVLGVSRSNVSSTKHYAIYMGEETLTNYINDQLNRAVSHLIKVRIPKQNELLASKARSDAIKEKRLKEYNDYVSTLENLWAPRFTASYELGAQVCSYDNKMGYIEHLGGGNQKILWKGKVVHESDGYFFGNRPQRTYMADGFRYEKINDIRWEAKQNIAKCSFTL